MENDKSRYIHRREAFTPLVRNQDRQDALIIEFAQEATGLLTDPNYPHESHFGLVGQPQEAAERQNQLENSRNRIDKIHHDLMELERQETQILESMRQRPPRRVRR